MATARGTRLPGDGDGAIESGGTWPRNGSGGPQSDPLENGRWAKPRDAGRPNQLKESSVRVRRSLPTFAGREFVISRSSTDVRPSPPAPTINSPIGRTAAKPPSRITQVDFRFALCPRSAPPRAFICLRLTAVLRYDSRDGGRVEARTVAPEHVSSCNCRRPAASLAARRRPLHEANHVANSSRPLRPRLHHSTRPAKTSSPSCARTPEPADGPRESSLTPACLAPKSPDRHSMICFARRGVARLTRWCAGGWTDSDGTCDT